MPNVPESILIIRLRGIGDVVLTTPVLENLRLAFPQARIDYLTEPPSVPLLQDHPALRLVLSFEHQKWKKLSPLAQARAYGSFIQSIRHERYDWVIDLFGNPRTAILTLLSGARRRIGFDFRGRKLAYDFLVEPRGDRLHAVEFNLDVLRALAVPVRTNALSLPVSSAAGAYVEQFFHAQGLDSAAVVVAFNAFGGWYTKRWPLASFAALGDRLQQECGAKVLLLWGPGEWEEVQQMASMMKSTAVLAPPTTLPQLTALLARASLLVANDSGPMHIAAAVGTPMVAIFGPTRPDLQGPWGKGHKIESKAGLPCLGCNGLTCKIQTHECMLQLPVAQVFEAVRTSLNQLGLTLAGNAASSA